MLRQETREERAFRADVRAWFDANLPPALRHKTVRPSLPELRAWFKAVSARGWIAPHWPRIHGGMEASPVQQIILIEETVRAGAPDLPAQGLNHIGPLLVARGSAAQKREHLPKILSGEVLWAQGYSEPGSGSDLTSLSTRGTVEGDKIIIRGHKIWNTYAHYADWLFALVRTGEGRSRRDGISFIIMDMKTQGITPRPVRTLAGDDELCEIFFDGAEVPLANVVGEIGGGWAVANTLLAQERIRSGNPVHALRALRQLDEAARATGADHDPWLLDRIARAELKVMALEASYIEALELLAAGEADAEDSSRLKVLESETTQFVCEALQEVAGARAVTRERPVGESPSFSQTIMTSRRLSIRGGTNEIQRSIIAMRTLGLPRPGNA